MTIAKALAVALGLATAGTAMSDPALRLGFDRAKDVHYKGFTESFYGEAAGDDDVRVVLKGNEKVDTCWTLCTEPFALKKSDAFVSLDFDFFADQVRPSGGTLSFCWQTADGTEIRSSPWRDALGILRDVDVHDLYLVARKYSHFRFVGEVPEGAASVVFKFMRDIPNVNPGDYLAFKGLFVSSYAKEQLRPKEIRPDCKGPLVTIAFHSPATNELESADYFVSDRTGVDWATLVVTDKQTGERLNVSREGGRVRIRPSVGRWGAGDHHLLVSVKDVLGNETCMSKAFRIGGRPRVPGTALRKDGAFLVGGKPTFPIGLYAFCPREENGWSLDRCFRDLKAAGVSLSHSYTHARTPQFLDGTRQYGMMSFLSESKAAEGSEWFETVGRDDAGIGLWYVGDDTSLNTEPEDVRNRVEALEALDGTRLTCHADVYGPRFHEYADLVDVFMPEIYPVHGKDAKEDEACVARTIDIMEKSWAEIRRSNASGKTRTILPIIQYFKGWGWRRFPTPEQLGAMSFAAIIHGGMGITWYTYGGFVNPDKKEFNYGVASSPETWSAMTNLTRRLSALKPVFLAPTVEDAKAPVVLSGEKTDAFGRSSVTAMVKRYNGRLYVLAVNAHNGTVRARFEFPREWRRCAVAWERRSVWMSGGSFEDEFGPYAVHVYELQSDPARDLAGDVFAPKWITGGCERLPADEKTFFGESPNGIVEKSFPVADDEIVRASWRVAAPGMRDLFVNGQRVTSTALSPWTPFGKRILEETFDVSPFLRSGAENVLRVELGNGWFNPLPLKFWYVHNLRETLSVGTPCVRAVLEIEYRDGRREIVPTDGSWRAADGQRVKDSIYLGETVDLRRSVVLGRAAREVPGPGGEVLPAEDFPKTVVYRRWLAQDVTEVSNGVWLVDMGVNFAGTFKARMRNVKDGQVIRFRKGERKHADGTVNVMTAVAGQIKDPARGPLHAVAEECDTLVCRAQDEVEFEPRMAFHVFRYIQVEGASEAPIPGDFEALAWSADVRERSGFACSNEKLNSLHEICRRTFRANLQSVQSDCPGREKFGYGGDIACTAEAFWCNYDMRAFYRKTVRDFLDEARDDGILTETAPYVGLGSRGVFPRNEVTKRGSASMGWAVGLPVLLETLVRYAGDVEIVKEAYPSLRRYIGLVRSRYPEDEIPECLGDWIPAVEDQKADTRMSALAHWHQFVRLTASFARLLGKSDDERIYEEMAQSIAERFRSRFINGGLVANGSQGDQLFGLYHGLVSDRDAAYERLRTDIVQRGDALTTGIFGTKYLLDVLPSFGDAHLAGRIVEHEGHPGWMNMLDRGATTLWEHWDEGQCLDVHSNCHPMFGSVDAWLFRHVLGIRIADNAVGCDRMVVRPHPPADVDWARGWVDTPRGRIEVSWRRVNGELMVTKRASAGIQCL